MSSKLKKILIVLNIIIALLTIFNTLWLVSMTMTFQDVTKNFYSYFPFLQPSGYYYDIDDVGYIAYEYALPDEEKIKNDEDLHSYSPEEIKEILDEARAERESLRAAENQQ